MRVSKKWLNATFSSFHGFCLSHSLPAAKPAKYENLKVFIRSDVHAVRAGIKLKGQPPLNSPRVYRQTDERPQWGSFILIAGAVYAQSMVPSVEKGTQALKASFGTFLLFSSLELPPLVLRSSALNRPQIRLFRVEEF